uniref:Uncharacterized protein n=1 Tax=Arundo donax TaxID=35708 RepID=A0A0A9AZ52_ARUDO
MEIELETPTVWKANSILTPAHCPHTDAHSAEIRNKADEWMD